MFIGRTSASVLWYFGHLMQSQIIGKDLVLGKIECKRRREWQWVRWLDGITDSMDINLSKLKDIVKDRGTWPTAVHGVINSQTWLSDLIATTTDKGTNSFLGDIYHYSHMGTGIQAPLVLRSRHSRGIPWIAAAKIKIQDEPEIPSDRYWYTGGRQRENVKMALPVFISREWRWRVSI